MTKWIGPLSLLAVVAGGSWLCFGPALRPGTLEISPSEIVVQQEYDEGAPVDAKFTLHNRSRLPMTVSLSAGCRCGEFYNPDGSAFAADLPLAPGESRDVRWRISLADAFGKRRFATTAEFRDEAGKMGRAQTFTETTFITKRLRAIPWQLDFGQSPGKPTECRQTFALVDSGRGPAEAVERIDSTSPEIVGKLETEPGGAVEWNQIPMARRYVVTAIWRPTTNLTEARHERLAVHVRGRSEPLLVDCMMSAGECRYPRFHPPELTLTRAADGGYPAKSLLLELPAGAKIEDYRVQADAPLTASVESSAGRTVIVRVGVSSRGTEPPANGNLKIAVAKRNDPADVQSAPVVVARR